VVLLVPLTTSAGEWLESRVPQSATLHRHTELGDGAIFYALPIGALAVVIWWLQRAPDADRGGGVVAGRGRGRGVRHLPDRRFGGQGGLEQ